MQILKIVIIIADNNDLIDILIMDILCPNRITNQYSIWSSSTMLIQLTRCQISHLLYYFIQNPCSNNTFAGIYIFGFSHLDRVK